MKNNGNSNSKILHSPMFYLKLILKEPIGPCFYDYDNWSNWSMMVCTCGEFLACRHNTVKEIVLVQPEGKFVEFIFNFGPNSQWNCDCFRWENNSKLKGTFLHTLSTFNPLACSLRERKIIYIIIILFARSGR